MSQPNTPPLPSAATAELSASPPPIGPGRTVTGMAVVAGSSLVKLALLGLLVLLLFIPIAQITGLVNERQSRADEVAREIAATWGDSQYLLGPTLTIPYDVTRSSREVIDGKVVDTTFSERHLLHLLPEQVSWQGQLDPEVRSRGIFDVVVYASELTASGRFVIPAEPLADEPGAILRWKEARVAIGISDPKGLTRGSTLEIGGPSEEVDASSVARVELPFTPGTKEAANTVGIGISAALAGLVPPRPEPTGDSPLGGSGGAGSSLVLPFRFTLALRGSSDLRLLAAGEETAVELVSSWPSPSFAGSFLPNHRELRADGFTARWSVPYFGRSFPQLWINQTVDQNTLTGAAFGVTLVQPADGYQRTTRAVKYAALFIVLTFGLLFLLELLSPQRLHPAQYLLVGFSLCLFFVLLLALSEHLGFDPAYGLAAVATTGVIGGYAGAILGSGGRGLAVAAALATLYGYLFVLLQLEDYALLLGAIGLFVVLSGTMLLTRGLDWYKLEFRTTARP